MDKRALSYKEAGVDIDAANQSVDMIKKWVGMANRPEVLTDIGSFGGLFALDMGKYKEPVLVSGTDGVGTKLKIAQMTGISDTVGIDLVAMCVNDILQCGCLWSQCGHKLWGGIHQILSRNQQRIHHQDGHRSQRTGSPQPI